MVPAHGGRDQWPPWTCPGWTGSYQPKRQSGYGQQEQQLEEQQSICTAKGCAVRPSVCDRRSSSASVSSVNTVTSFVVFIDNGTQRIATLLPQLRANIATCRWCSTTRRRPT